MRQKLDTRVNQLGESAFSSLLPYRKTEMNLTLPLLKELMQQGMLKKILQNPTVLTEAKLNNSLNAEREAATAVIILSVPTPCLV